MLIDPAKQDSDLKTNKQTKHSYGVFQDGSERIEA